MKLHKVYEGTIKYFHGTLGKIAIFTDGKNIKVFQKEFFRNSYGLVNWTRNVILERINNVKKIEERLISLGFEGFNK